MEKNMETINVSQQMVAGFSTRFKRPVRGLEGLWGS